MSWLRSCTPATWIPVWARMLETMQAKAKGRGRSTPQGSAHQTPVDILPCRQSLNPPSRCPVARHLQGNVPRGSSPTNEMQLEA
eukprot:3255545-Amphidinium_carterae.1